MTRTETAVKRVFFSEQQGRGTAQRTGPLVFRDPRILHYLLRLFYLQSRKHKALAFQINFRTLTLLFLEAVNKAFCMCTYMFMCVCWEQKITPGHILKERYPRPPFETGSLMLSWAGRSPSRLCGLRVPCRLRWLPVSPRRLPVIASQHRDHKCAIVFCLFT